jgi:hypothetical protein
MYSHFYKFEHGSFTFYSGAFKPQIQFTTPQVSVLYDQETGALVKHGREEDVNRWLLKYSKGGFRGLVVVRFPPDYPVEEINAMIHTTGSVPFHVDRASKGRHVSHP